MNQTLFNTLMLRIKTAKTQAEKEGNTARWAELDGYELNLVTTWHRSQNGV